MTETVEFGGSAPAHRRFVLVVMRPDGAERVAIDGTLLIGKHPENDVVIDAPGVSRYHLELRAERDAVRIKDAGSKNGTFYDGARITEVRLLGGATLRVGGPTGTELRIELDRSPKIRASTAHRFGPLIGSSLPMRQVFSILERVAPSDTTVLVTGETGTGKEVAARALHEASSRRAGPYVVVDCGAIAASLLEVSSSATLGVRSPTPARSGKARLKPPTAERCSWTKSANSRSTCSLSSCALWSPGPSSVSAKTIGDSSTSG